MSDDQTLEQDRLLVHYRSRYERTNYLLSTVLSLLHKYGTATELDLLSNSLMFTLMGQYVTTDACYYARDDERMHPVAAQGRLSVGDLPTLSISDLVGAEEFDTRPRLLQESPEQTLAWPEQLHHFHVVAPMHVRGRLEGLVLLGARVSGKAYDPDDLEVLQTLCTVSATTFSNAINITNTRAIVDELRRTHGMRAEMLSRISHEFRTPLTVIQASLELLEGEESQPLRECVQQATHRLGALIDSLLDISKDVRPDAKSISWKAALGVIHEVTRRVTLNDRVSVSLSHVDTCSPRISRDDLSVITEQLVRNALQFSDQEPVVVTVEKASPQPDVDGELLSPWRQLYEEKIQELEDASPSVGRLEVLERDSGDRSYYALRVTDLGIGIPADDIRQLSEPFRQASNSPNLGVKGSGLGLARVLEVATRNDGFVYCRSSENQGTTFSVFLPID